MAFYLAEKGDRLRFKGNSNLWKGTTPTIQYLHNSQLFNEQCSVIHMNNWKSNTIWRFNVGILNTKVIVEHISEETKWFDNKLGKQGGR